MSVILEHDLTHLEGLTIRAEGADVVEWQGQRALRLLNGLALIPGRCAMDASIEVSIGVDAAAYPGVAFRLADVLNYELAYPVPHVSGQWDALQYDPVFHGSNTWQLYNGPAYQRAADVPTGRWFQLRVDFCGSRAAISVDGQPPLVVTTLARPQQTGFLGLWTYLPAHFCDLRVSTCVEGEISDGEEPHAPEGTLREWLLEGYGAVACEPNGTVNLNRYLAFKTGEAGLSRRFDMAERGMLEVAFGFSDALTLELDGQAIYAGENTFTGFADRAARGYVEPGMASVATMIEAGTHTLAATLRTTEGFGWGLTLAAHASGLQWLPVELG
jgi:hypothetical protein